MIGALLMEWLWRRAMARMQGSERPAGDGSRYG
jgi:hypothetical protein